MAVRTGSAEAAGRLGQGGQGRPAGREAEPTGPVVPAAMPGRRRHRRPHASKPRRTGVTPVSTDVTTPVPARTPTLTPGPDRPGRRERSALLRGRADMKVSPYLYIAPFFVAVRRLRALPAGLHRLGVAARLGAGRRRAPVRRPGQLPAAGHRRGTSGTRWSTRSASSCSSTVPQLLLALVLANLLNRRLRGADLLPDGRAAAERHLASPRSRSSSASCSAATSASSTGCSAWSASSRSTGRRTGGRPGSRSRPWSTGGGPATTR